jgi:hypothetical protein
MRLPKVIAVTLAAAFASGGCAVKLYEPPAGPGQPFADAAAVWRTLTEGCRNANRLLAEIHVDGWAGEGNSKQSLPGFPMHTALTRDDDMYLEVPGLGKSYVQMAGRAGQSVFLLPREDRVLRAAARDIIDRLIGLRWGAKDLLNVLSGCIATPSGEFPGTLYGTKAVIDLGGDARAYLRQRGGRWQLEAADRDGYRIEYPVFDGNFPSLIRVASVSANVTPLRLKFSVNQLQVNTTLEASTFTLEVPPNFLPMTLDELRSVKPLRDVKGSALRPPSPGSRFAPGFGGVSRKP